ncbi:MAG: DUF58 domain-containing protein [Lachnospiraceae bacterium]|nr:DUF58 domain-containing protein [Lachnospiraceae bacterium]
MLKTWVIYSVSLFASIIFFLCYKMWVSWFCLVVILLIPFLALGMCIIASRTLTFKTESPKSCPLGDPSYIRITMNGIASYFAFCKVRTTVTDRMAGTSGNLSIMINDNGVTKVPVETSHCGAYSYRLTRIEIYDLFGFFHANKNINKDNEYLVRPVPSMPEVMPDMYGFKARNLRKAKQPYTEIYDIREYQTGDPVRSIHWKMSAKKDKLMVKEPLEEYGGHSRVLLKLTSDRDKLDLHLGQILFTSRFFIEHETAHKIRVIPPDRSEVAFDIESEADLERAIAAILRMRIPDDKPADKAMPDDGTSGEDSSHEEAPHAD